MLRHDAYVECYHLYEFGECYHHQVHEPQDKLTEELPDSKKRKICQLLIDQETIKKRYIFEGKTQLHMPRNLIIHVTIKRHSSKTNEQKKRTVSFSTTLSASSNSSISGISSSSSSAPKYVGIDRIPLFSFISKAPWTASSHLR